MNAVRHQSVKQMNSNDGWGLGSCRTVPMRLCQVAIGTGAGRVEAEPHPGGRWAHVGV
jgi:hypothetical protein